MLSLCRSRSVPGAKLKQILLGRNLWVLFFYFLLRLNRVEPSNKALRLAEGYTPTPACNLVAVARPP